MLLNISHLMIPESGHRGLEDLMILVDGQQMKSREKGKVTEGIESHRLNIIGLMNLVEVVILFANSLLLETAAMGNFAGFLIMAKHATVPITGREMIGDKESTVWIEWIH